MTVKNSITKLRVQAIFYVKLYVKFINDIFPVVAIAIRDRSWMLFKKT